MSAEIMARIREERRKIWEWNDGCTGGGIDPPRASTIEVSYSLRRIGEKHNNLDNFLGLDDYDLLVKKINDEINRVQKATSTIFKKRIIKILQRVLNGEGR